MRNKQMVEELEAVGARAALVAQLRKHPSGMSLADVLVAIKDEAVLIDICTALGIRERVEVLVEWLKREGRLLRIQAETALRELDARFEEHAAEQERRTLGAARGFGGQFEAQWQGAKHKLRLQLARDHAEIMAQRKHVRGRWLRDEEQLEAAFAVKVAAVITSYLAEGAQDVA